MAGIFTRLYTWRERPSISPLENFLTEALADLIARLPEHLKRSLVVRMLPAGSREAADKLLAGRRIEASTQVTIPTGATTKTPDIVVYADGEPFLVIEAKVRAALQQHVTAGSSEGDTPAETRNQLETYASWIAGDARSWPGAVTLLTFKTDPPDDFIEGRADGVYRAVCTWKDVGDWIIGTVEIARGDVTYCAHARDFWQFLKEQKLMSRYATSRDLAAAHLFLPACDALFTTFDAIISAVAKHVPKLKGGRQISVEFWGELNLYCGWFFFDYAVRPEKTEPYLAIGICFEVPSQYAADIPKLPKDEPFFFAWCRDDWEGRKVASFLSSIPQGWTEIEDGRIILAARPVRDFPSDPDARVEGLKAWACEEADKLAASLPRYAAMREGRA